MVPPSPGIATTELTLPPLSPAVNAYFAEKPIKGNPQATEHGAAVLDHRESVHNT
jgi:hypothetical protein